MKHTTSIKTAIPTIILTTALVASCIPFTAMTSRAATISNTAAAQSAKVDDSTRNLLYDLYDSSSAFLSLHSSEIPNDVRLSLECARNNGYAALNSDSLSTVTAACSDLRVALRVAESTYAGIPVDTNAAPDYIIGTNGGNKTNAFASSSATAATIGSVYATNRNVTPEILRQRVVNNFVERLYPVALGRTADIAARDMYTNAIINGTMTPDEVAASVLLSTESTNRLSSNTAFVTACYRALLDREPDAQGLTNWVNALNNGMTRAELVNTFEAQSNWTNLCSCYGF